MAGDKPLRGTGDGGSREDSAGDGRERLTGDQPVYGGGGGAKGEPNTVLARALRDDEAGDAHNADRGEEKGHDREAGEQDGAPSGSRGGASGNLIEGLELEERQ